MHSTLLVHREDEFELDLGQGRVTEVSSEEVKLQPWENTNKEESVRGTTSGI